MRAREVLGRQAEAWGLEIGTEAEASLLRYAQLLSSYDRANVIGTRDPDQVLEQHVLDSLSCLLFPPLREARMLADVGSGGGLPGIPLAVMLPDAEVTLFESVKKKVDFLTYAADALGIENLRVANRRVEETARDEAHRQAYDVCAVRAVARLAVISEYCLPLLRMDGHVVAMKGRDDQEESKEGERAASLLGGRVRGEIRVPLLPLLEQKERRLVLLHKVEQTPEVYPRRTGTPARDPLGRR